MKNRFIVIYSFFAAAVFIFSITYFGFNLYREYSTNQEKSETRYKTLVNDIRTQSFSQKENTAAYIQGIKTSIGDTGNYSYIHVRRANETVILYPAGKSKEETVSKLTKSFSSNITVNENPINIECNIYLIRPDSIFYYARVSFLMILIITIITFIMIIYLNLSEATSDVISLEEGEPDEIQDDSEIALSEEAVPDEEDTSDEETDNTIAEENLIPEETEIETSEEPEVQEQETEIEESKAEVTPEEVQAILAEPLTDEQAAAAEQAKLPVDEVKPAPIETKSDSNEPAGLFDPDTGIGWESYLLTRLNNEIDRATASEIDLSLFIIKIPGIDMKSEVFKNICNYLTIQFQFKDLLFEYKTDCIVAIKISMNVDEALKLGDKLYGDISNMVDGNQTRIGISSRSIRMLTGDRLILEAEQSIEHSDSSSPVIAFRVDSEKYRQLMEQSRD